MPGSHTVVPFARSRGTADRAGRSRLATLLLVSAALGTAPASAEGPSGPTALVGLVMPGREPVQAIVPINPDGSIRVRFGNGERSAGLTPNAGLAVRKSSSTTNTKGSVEAVIDANGVEPNIRVDAALRETLILDPGKPAASPENESYEVFAWSFGKAGRMERAGTSRRFEHMSKDAILVIEIPAESVRPSGR